MHNIYIYMYVSYMRLSAVDSPPVNKDTYPVTLIWSDGFQLTTINASHPYSVWHEDVTDVTDYVTDGSHFVSQVSVCVTRRYLYLDVVTHPLHSTVLQTYSTQSVYHLLHLTST